MRVNEAGESRTAEGEDGTFPGAFPNWNTGSGTSSLIKWMLNDILDHLLGNHVRERGRWVIVAIPQGALILRSATISTQCKTTAFSEANSIWRIEDIGSVSLRSLPGTV